MNALQKTADLLRLAVISVATAAAGVVGVASPQGAQAPAAPSIGSIPGSVIKLEMVPVPGGSVNIDGAAVNVEPFLIGRTEVTWDMYDLFALGRGEARDQAGADAITRPSQPYGAPDYNWGHAGYPVISVTRDAAETFCRWLSAQTGRTYRLPTEAEWRRAAELAAEGTSPAQREAITWHRGNSKGTTHPVGTRKADALGLMDLFGNAAEWVATNDDQLVTRGGSFRDPLEKTGPSARGVQDPSWNERDPQLPKSRWWLSDGPFVGFRLVTPARER